MSRLLFLAVLLACVFYVLQASPVSENTEQSTPASNDMDHLAAEAKKMLDEAKGLFSNVNLNDAMETAKTYLSQAGDNIRKELEKISEKVQG